MQFTNYSSFLSKTTGIFISEDTGAGFNRYYGKQFYEIWDLYDNTPEEKVDQFVKQMQERVRETMHVSSQKETQPLSITLYLSARQALQEMGQRRG